jgi:1-acyl-sn-glycerol-3-phosphate acyltransferase
MNTAASHLHTSLGPRRALRTDLPPAGSLGYAVLKAFAKACTLLCGQTADVEWPENIPSGPKVIAANHPNVSDGLLLPAVFPERLHYLIQADVFETPIVGALLSLSSQIPVVRGRGSEALAEACRHLSKGHSVVIFPEGRLNPSGALCKPGTGAVRMAVQAGVPIVPVGLHVPAPFARVVRLPRKGRTAEGRWQIGGRCYIQIGEAWHVAREIAVPAAPQDLRHMSHVLMDRINSLARQAAERTRP